MHISVFFFSSFPVAKENQSPIIPCPRSPCGIDLRSRQTHGLASSKGKRKKKERKKEKERKDIMSEEITK